MFATDTPRVKQSVIMTHHQVRLNLHQCVKNNTHENEKGGATKEGSKFSVTVESIVILGVVEIIPCTEEAIKSIESVPEWRA